MLRRIVIGLLFLGAIVFVGALLVPGQIGAIPRSRQKRTMADIRNLASAVESFAADHRTYPVAGSVEELARQIQPRYIQVAPLRDAWGTPLRYVAWKELADSPGADSYVIASAGREGKWEEGDPRRYSPAVTTGYEADIVFRSGAFIRTPSGVR